MSTPEAMGERISRLEGVQVHQATKADLHEMENRLIRWMVTITLGGMATAATLTLAIQQLVD